MGSSATIAAPNIEVFPPIQTLSAAGARQVSLTVDVQEISLSDIKAEIEAADLRLDRLVIRAGDSPEAERVEVYLARGSSEEKLLLLMESLRRLAGVREISSSVDEVRSIR